MVEESDEEFLKRIQKIREDATERLESKKELHEKEYKKGKEMGTQMRNIVETYEKYKKIIEEFKRDPPIMRVRVVNGVTMKREYDKKYIDKVNFLKENKFKFPYAKHTTYIDSPFFKVHGEAYVVSGGVRKKLPSKSTPPVIKKLGGSSILDPNNEGVILKDGDVIVTGEGSFVDLSGINASDKNRRDLLIHPNSEVILKISEKVTHPKPNFINPSKVPEIIKQKTKVKNILYTVEKFILQRGIFKIDLLNKQSNPNNLLQINPKYPQIEFLDSSKTWEIMVEEAHKQFSAPPPKQPKKEFKLEEISAFVEFCENNSLVIFGTGNAVKHLSTGKVAINNIPKLAKMSEGISGKITVLGNRIYSSKSDYVDPRVSAIMNYANSIGLYYSTLEDIKEFEQKAKESKESPAPPRKETPEEIKYKEERKRELLEQLEYLEKVKDKEMSDAIKMQIEELERPPQLEYEYDNAALEATIKSLKKIRDDARPHISANFPPYDSVKESDAV